MCPENDEEMPSLHLAGSLRSNSCYEHDDIPYDCENGLIVWHNNAEWNVREEQQETFSQFVKHEVAILRCASCYNAITKVFSALTLAEVFIYFVGWHWLYNNTS